MFHYTRPSHLLGTFKQRIRENCCFLSNQLQNCVSERSKIILDLKPIRFNSLLSLNLNVLKLLMKEI